MNDDPTTAILCLLVEVHGIPARKVTSLARIVHDLGVDGDDAAELLNDLRTRFGTDLSALDAQWGDFFNTEGTSPRAVLIGVPTIIACDAFGGLASAVLKWPTLIAVLLSLSLFVAACWLASRWFGRELKPLTVGALARIVEAGRWPADPADVR